MQLKYIYRERTQGNVALGGRPMSRLLPTLLGTLLCCATASEAADPRNVGEAVVIKNQVTAADTQQDKRRLTKGDAVREQELLEAQTVSHGEFRLADDTKLALGPNARLVLDKFVYDPDKTGKQVLINFAVGSFRFISSSKDPTGYELKAPNATLGIRGTVFDFYVAEKGRMVVLMHKGAVDVYTPNGAIIYRNFDAKGESKPTPLKPPKTVLHAALMRHFRECILGKAKPIIGTKEGIQLMQMLDAIYKSSETGKSAEIR